MILFLFENFQVFTTFRNIEMLFRNWLLGQWRWIEKLLPQRIAIISKVLQKSILQIIFPRTDISTRRLNKGVIVLSIQISHQFAQNNPIEPLVNVPRLIPHWIIFSEPALQCLILSLRLQLLEGGNTFFCIFLRACFAHLVIQEE